MIRLLARHFTISHALVGMAPCARIGQKQVAGVQGIGRRDRVPQLVARKDGARRSPRVHFDADFHLVLHQPTAMLHQAGQMHQLAVGTGAAYRLAIQRPPHQLFALFCDDAAGIARKTSIDNAYRRW